MRNMDNVLTLACGRKKSAKAKIVD
jgi:hypothetical protein